MKSSRQLTAVGLAMVVLACKEGSTPRECENVDFIFDSDACLEALTARCREITTEADCWAAESMADDYAYCAWTNVATVADAQTCEIATTFGRCEAAVRAPWDGPVNACANGEFYDYAVYTAFVDDRELVDDYVTGPDGNFYQALLFWTGDDVAICGEGWSAPVETAPAPEWCSCGPAACMATGD